jgi:hypothetical protein
MIKSLTGIAIGTLLCTVASAQTIEDRVRELERRVQQLEKAAAQAPAPAPVTANAAAAALVQQLMAPPPNLEKWRALKRGMRQPEVRALLGEPSIESVNQVYTRWEYPRDGKLQFNTSDGRLDMWAEPR